MEVVEIVVYIFVAVVVGSLVLFTLSSFDYGSINETLSSDSDEEEFVSVNSEEFYGTLISSVDSCREDSFVRTIFVDDSEVVSKETFFELVKQASLCNSIQSEEYSCGEQEDIDEFSFQTPKVVTIICEEERLKIE